jgi:hypothetical protein
VNICLCWVCSLGLLGEGSEMVNEEMRDSSTGRENKCLDMQVEQFGEGEGWMVRE